MKHKHNFKLQSTQYQYPVGYSGTVTAVEYAYLMCDSCWEVVKKEVKLSLPKQGGKE